MSQHLYTFKSVTRGLRSYHHHHHLYHHHLDCHHHHDHDNHDHHDQQRLKWPLWNPFPELQPTKRQYPSLCIKSWWIFSGCIPVLSPSPVLYLCPSFFVFPPLQFYICIQVFVVYPDNSHFNLSRRKFHLRHMQNYLFWILWPAFVCTIVPHLKM